MDSSTYTGNSQQAYMVEGRKFERYAMARAFAENQAKQVGRMVRIMEKVPGLPWHVVADVKGAES